MDIDPIYSTYLHRNIALVRSKYTDKFIDYKQGKW
jgi:hypothetical protein